MDTAFASASASIRSRLRFPPQRVGAVLIAIRQSDENAGVEKPDEARSCQHPAGCPNPATKGWFCDEHQRTKAQKRAANPAKGESFVAGKNTLARAPRQKRRPRQS